jgi:hypothetical protein
VEGNLLDKVKNMADRFGISSEDIKNLSIANLLLKMNKKADSEEDNNLLTNLLNMAKGMGIENKKLK